MSETKTNPAIVGGLAGAAGLVIGAFLSLSTLHTKVADGLDATQSPVADALAEQGGAIAALADRLGAIEAAVAENATSVGSLNEAVAGMGDSVSASMGGMAEQVEGRVAESIGGIGDQLTQLRDSLSAQIDQAAGAQGAALETALANLPAPSQTAAAPDATTGAAPSEDTDEEPAFVSAGDLGEGDETFGVGQTAMFADGAVRAFVQRKDEDAGRAVLSINGISSSVGAGESTVARHADGSCRVGVSGISGDGVMVVSDCDADIAGGELGTAYTPGNTASFADDTLRVFVSGVVNGDARLAVNGLGTQIVPVGQPLEIETGESSCVVQVHGVRGNHVAMSADCG